MDDTYGVGNWVTSPYNNGHWFDGCDHDHHSSRVIFFIEVPIDSGIALSIRIDNLGVFINKTLSTESLINQLFIKRVCLSISIDSR
jgi:hypothetical protein